MECNLCHQPVCIGWRRWCALKHRRTCKLTAKTVARNVQSGMYGQQAQYFGRTPEQMPALYTAWACNAIGVGILVGVVLFLIWGVLYVEATLADAIFASVVFGLILGGCWTWLPAGRWVTQRLEAWWSDDKTRVSKTRAAKRRGQR